MKQKDFLSNIVFGWIKHDLENMKNEIPPHSKEVGNIHFPLTICVLSYMEYLGSFLKGEEGNFTENVRLYIDECFHNSGEYQIDILRDLFRNGLSHEYFARGAISRDGEHPAMYKDKTFGVILDAETLVDDFLSSLDVFKDRLDKTKYEDRMKETLNTVQSLQRKLEKQIYSLPTRCTKAQTPEIQNGDNGSTDYSAGVGASGITWNSNDELPTGVSGYSGPAKSS